MEEYLAGLVSNIKRKNIESIAYLHEQDRQPLQKFIGQNPWEWQPMIGELAQQIAATLGEATGVLVIDPSGVLKQGKGSVGVARQWCGRAGKVDNCQVGVYLGYVTRKEHALVDTRLYLPKEWTKDKKRCRQAGIPKDIRFRTRHELALEMLREHCFDLAACLGDGRRRNGPKQRLSRGIAADERTLPVGRAIEHPDPRLGGRAADVQWFGTTAGRLPSSVRTPG